MNKISIYINDNTYQVINDKITTIYSKSIFNSNIQNKILFLNEFRKSNKEYKFMNFIIPYNLTIYLNFPITEKDKYYYTNIFEELNFYNIDIKYIYEVLDNKTYLINNENSMYILYKNNTYYISKDILNEFINIKNIDKLYSFGNNKKQIKLKQLYTYSNSVNYIATKVLGINKLVI